MHKGIYFGATLAAIFLGNRTLLAAENDLGVWTLNLGSAAAPSATLDFHKALFPPMGEPDIDSLELSCGTGHRVVYRLKSKVKHDKLSHQEGEEYYEFKLKSDGTFPPKEAARFVKLITPLIKSYADLKQKQQLIDLSGGQFNFYGFTRVRAAMRDACAHENATTSSAGAAPDAGRPDTPLAPTNDGSAEKAVMMMLYGTTKSPYTQTVMTAEPFNRYEKVVRTVTISKIDNCKYSILSDVTHSDVPLVTTVGKLRYEIDFGKIGTIDVSLANNAYEAVAWDPMMVVYPAQKEIVKRHVVSKVVNVSLNMVEPEAFCIKFLDPSKPNRCMSSKSFEINPEIASQKRVTNAANFFKEHVCKGKPF